MRSRVAALVALALAALALLATAATAATGRYVALGGSYTAGPLIPDQSLSPLGCLRSDVNYPHLVRPALETATFTDRRARRARGPHIVGYPVILLRRHVHLERRARRLQGDRREVGRGLVPTSPAAPVHPNALGMQNTASVTLARINAVGC